MKKQDLSKGRMLMFKKDSLLVLFGGILLGIITGLLIYLYQPVSYQTTIELKLPYAFDIIDFKRIEIEDYSITQERIKSNHFRHRVAINSGLTEAIKILDEDICSNCIRIRPSKNEKIMIITVISKDWQVGLSLAEALYRNIKLDQDELTKDFQKSLDIAIEGNKDKVYLIKNKFKLVEENKASNILVNKTDLLNPISVKEKRLFKRLLTTELFFVFLSLVFCFLFFYRKKIIATFNSL